MKAAATIVILSIASTCPGVGTDELLKNPEVRKAKEACDDLYENRKNYEPHGNIGDCMWARIPEKERKKIKNSLEPHDVLSPTITEPLQIPLSAAERKALDGLREHLKEKLSEAIRAGFGEDEPVYVSPKTIYDLYEQRIGKNVIEAATSFCFEAGRGDEGNYLIKKSRDERKKRRQEHLEQLKVTETKGLKSLEVFDSWSECIASIAPICHKKEGGSTDDDIYTKKRACEVTNYLQAMKKALLATKDIKKALSDLIPQSSLEIGTNVYSGGTHQGGIGTNEATTLTSRDIAESRYEQEARRIGDRQEECRKQKPNKKDGLCEEFLIADNDGLKAGDELAGLALKTKARREQMEEFIESAKDVDTLIDEELKKIGIDKQKKEAYLAKLDIQEPKEVLKKLSLDRYDAERKTLIASLKERLEKNTKKQKKEEASEQALTIGQELASKAEEYKQLLHFNNVVSSFLEVRNPDGSVSKNTTALVLELENDAFGDLGEDKPEDSHQWGRIDYKTGEGLLKLKEETAKNEDAPVLSEKEIDWLLEGGNHPEKEEKK